MAVLAPFPNFLILGVERNATGWLRFNLDRHPDICAPPLDLSFFTDEDLMAERGLRWYREQYDEWDGETFVGEAASDYLAPTKNPLAIAGRIERLLPDVRLLAIVGDPVDRFESAWRHRVRWGLLDADVDPTDFAALRQSRPDHFAVIFFDLYFSSLQAPLVGSYRDRFGDQLLILLRDDIRDDPAGVYRAALRHIGADDAFVPDGVELVRYSDKPRYPDLVFTEEQRQYLYAWFRGDVRQLETLLDRDLSAWDPGVGPTTLSREEINKILLGDG